MDKFMHKVKEAISGHHNENKDSSQGSSKMGMDHSSDPSNDNQGTAMGSDDHRSAFDTGQGDVLDSGNSPSNKQSLGKDASLNTDNAYASNNPSGNDGPLNSNKLEDMAGDTYGSTNAEKEPMGSGSLGADNSATGNMMKDTENTYGDNTYGSTNTDMDTSPGLDTKKSTGQNMGGYGGLGPDPHKEPDYNSANMGGYGTAVNDLRDSDKKIGIDSALNLENREGFGNTTAVTSGSDDLKPSDAGSNMIGDSGNTDLAGKQGFGGTAAGGSSYNSPDSGKRRSSGPHKSNFLNSLDPRVHKADYARNTEDEGNMAGNQRGF